MKKVKLSIRYFPPYRKYYVSANSHVDDYLSNGGIHRLFPTYFSTFEEAKGARDKYVADHPNTAEPN